MSFEATIREMLEESRREEFDELTRPERALWLKEAWGLDEHQLRERLADLSGMPTRPTFSLSNRAERALPLRLIHEYQCLPVRAPDVPEEDPAEANAEPLPPGEPLNLVTSWPPDPIMDEWIFAACSRPVEWTLGPAEEIANTITQVYGIGSGSLEDDSADLLAEAEQEEEEDEEAALIRFVNDVITKAVADRATDIHFEPRKDALQIRYRIDGALVPVRVPDNLVRFQRAIIARLKIMARLNISERRRPQDGRISFQLGREELDIRISSLPTMYGESVSLRLLSNKGAPVTIPDLGFIDREQKLIDQILARPHGIILATGPTGSGKSTTLSAFLRRIRDPRRRLITIEDPVEYEIEGVNQTQVHSDIGLTFASALRSVLRQDPDVIMVGEIRDRETAEIAIRASLTGHLVLSTLHTNDAPGALTRLIDMEIEPFLIASSVELIIAQRLVRRLCPHCAQPTDIDAAELNSALRALGLPLTEANRRADIREPLGCEACRGFGYRGRVGLFELLRVNDEIHEMIVNRSSARDIRSVAIRHGMNTLQQSGWTQVLRGITSLEEVLRFADILGDIEEPELQAPVDVASTNEETELPTVLPGRTEG
ncbi:MAG: GspE/PulE family protein [Opitutales bacterium]